MKKTCKECGEEFELLPGKPGFANVCPNCSVAPPEQTARQIAEAERLRKSLTTSVRTNEKHRTEERQHDIALERRGFKKVPGRKFTVRVPK